MATTLTIAHCPTVQSGRFRFIPRHDGGGPGRKEDRRNPVEEGHAGSCGVGRRYLVGHTQARGECYGQAGEVDHEVQISCPAQQVIEAARHARDRVRHRHVAAEQEVGQAGLITGVTLTDVHKGE